MLELRDLRIELATVPILRGLTLELDGGDALGIVGESGSGKSLAALAILGLTPPNMRVSGSIRFENVELIGLPEAAFAAIRGRRIGMVFQEPMSALNPVHRIGAQIAEGLVQHRLLGPSEAWQEAIRLLGRVGVDSPESRARAYPHQLSGGQRQRVMIAMAIACKPGLLIADEPTSALDVSVQAEILDLLTDLRHETGMSLLFISHDLAVIARMARKVAVLYAGAIMEMGDTAAILHQPAHPYTRGLLDALPHGVAAGTRLSPIAGQVPAPAFVPKGCPFYGRCPRGEAHCAREAPPLQRGETLAFCFHPLAPH